MNVDTPAEQLPSKEEQVAILERLIEKNNEGTLTPEEEAALDELKEQVFPSHEGPGLYDCSPKGYCLWCSLGWVAPCIAGCLIERKISDSACAGGGFFIVGAFGALILTIFMVAYLVPLPDELEPWVDLITQSGVTYLLWSLFAASTFTMFKFIRHQRFKFSVLQNVRNVKNFEDETIFHSYAIACCCFGFSYGQMGPTVDDMIDELEAAGSDPKDFEV